MKVEAESVLLEIEARSQSMRAMAKTLLEAGSRQAAQQVIAHCEGLEHARDVIARHGKVKREHYETKTA